LPLIKVELHCHTYRSPDSLMMPERILQICQQRGIDRIAITDHNSIAGALEAAAIDPQRVIVGEEILTTKGELLAFFVREEVPAGLEPMLAIEQLRSQGALISVSHPLDPMRSKAWAEEELRQILPYVDALEVFNARTMLARADRKALEITAEVGLMRTAGSDAHAYCEIGRATMRLPAFEDVDGMRRALPEAAIAGRRSSPLVHFCSRYATFRKALGWRPPP
jgi:predicted metal-dependent phosphoesterase TrpH